MRRPFHLHAVALGLSALVTTVPAKAASHDIIEYRQQARRTLEAQFLMVTAGAPAENRHSHLTAALLTARMLPAAFEPRALGGASQPQIWMKGDGFAHSMSEFEASVAIATEAARNGTKPADVLFHLDAISCRKCHDTYRRH
jgi:cytochrome c556